jgi:hypothetical protein
MPGWNMGKMMCQAGGAGLEQVIAAADDAMSPGGLPVRSCQAFNEYSLFLFHSRDTGRQTAKTWYSCAHLMLARIFASALIPCGIAAFFSCFPFIPAQTLELSYTTARLFPCCGSMMQLHPVLNDAYFF